MSADAIDRMEFDAAGYHTAKVDNCPPIIVDCVDEAIEETKDRLESDGSYAEYLANDDWTSFSVSLGNDEAKRTFADVCDELAEENDDLELHFRSIRSLTVNKINKQRDADGLEVVV